MKVQSALLCDAASVREGLLHVLGGGLALGVRSVFPAPLGVALALLLEADPSDLGGTTEVTIDVVHTDSREVSLFHAEGVLEPEQEPDDPRISLVAPMTMDLHAVPVPSAGLYVIVVALDGQSAVELPLLLMDGAIKA